MSFTSQQYYILHPDAVHHHIAYEERITSLQHRLLTSPVHPNQLYRVKNALDQTIVNQALALVDIHYKNQVITTRLDEMIRAITQLMVNHDLDMLLFHTPDTPRPPTEPSTPSLPSSEVPSPPVLTDLSYDSDHPVEIPLTNTNIDWKKRKPSSPSCPPRRRRNAPPPRSPPSDYDPNDTVYYTRSGRRSNRNYYPPRKTSSQRPRVHPTTPQHPSTRLSPPVASSSKRPYSGPTRITIKKPHPSQYQAEEEGEDDRVNYDFYDAHDEVAEHNMDT